jgi:hypothetical protein
MSLMTEGGETKDDVKVPDGEVGDKINKLFKEEEKDTSESSVLSTMTTPMLIAVQTSLFSLPWVRRLPLTPRKLRRALRRIICKYNLHARAQPTGCADLHERINGYMCAMSRGRRTVECGILYAR